MEMADRNALLKAATTYGLLSSQALHCKAAQPAWRPLCDEACLEPALDF